MTVTEIAAELRVALRDSVADRSISVQERTFFTALQKRFRRRDGRTLVIAVSSQRSSRVHGCRRAVGKRGERFQRMDGAFGMEYSAREKLTRHIEWRQGDWRVGMKPPVQAWIAVTTFRTSPAFYSSSAYDRKDRFCTPTSSNYLGD